MRKLFQTYLNSYRGLSRPAWVLALIMLINRSGAMVIPFLGVYMTDALNFSLKDAGTILSCFGVGAVFGSTLGGWLSDKVGNFKVQFLCLLLAVPIFCLLPQLKDPISLAAGVFVLSVISETFRPANTVSIASYTTPENITKAFSLNRMAMNLGFSIGPALGGFLAAWSYHWLFYGNALSSGLAGLFFYLYFRGRGKRKLAKPEVSASRAMGSPWRDPYFLIFSFFCCLYSVCFFQLLSTLPLFYRTAHHLSEWNIGVILAFSGFVVFSLEMILVHIAGKRWSASTIIITGTLLCGASYLALLLPGKYPVLYFGMLLLCLSEILAMPFMATLTMQRSPRDKQGAYMGVNSLSFSAAHIISPFAGTRLASHFGFDVLWSVTGLVSILTAVGFYWVIRKL
ncbi:MDR family MFS transporter [Desertivirga xinjiangensis]|uniref:MDR family MFS transporter n=1 Tax=Desertivirga xinjiangensis TaxID=539206 RepID=UPI00210E1896|nr:MFS transporter [Pedobacter xinjiangensis]